MSDPDKERFCTRQDINDPNRQCGCPLPCPHHTATLDAGSGDIKIPEGVDSCVRGALKEISLAFKNSFEGREQTRGTGRPVASNDLVVDSLSRVRGALLGRLHEKGWGIHVSIHEILGTVTEEWKELTEAVQDNSHEEVGKKLLDLAVTATFGLASILSGKMDL